MRECVVDTGASKAIVSAELYQQYRTQLVARCPPWGALFLEAQCDQSVTVASGACLMALFRATAPLRAEGARRLNRGFLSYFHFPK